MLLLLSFNWTKIKKKITLFCSFFYSFSRKKKELEKEKEREIKQLSKQINPTFPRAFDLQQCQSRLSPAPALLSLNQHTQ